ncbi:hypothetical protein [Antarcticimicrobium luteum]|uniref:hypothetical protein n=1 Tax=Antarcticimicrobium luteum TaxID=2547397 RepID=UPI001FE02EBB|nr:hypothetical protein [Antarcticimicrobium luteum]
MNFSVCVPGDDHAVDQGVQFIAGWAGDLFRCQRLGEILDILPIDSRQIGGQVDRRGNQGLACGTQRCEFRIDRVEPHDQRFGILAILHGAQQVGVGPLHFADLGVMSPQCLAAVLLLGPKFGNEPLPEFFIRGVLHQAPA